MGWFRSLAAPRWQLPMPAFMIAGGGYYGIIGYVLARSLERRDSRSTSRCLAVLVGNEAWNGLFFGRRSARAGFVGLCAFLFRLCRSSQLSRGTHIRAVPWRHTPHTCFSTTCRGPTACGG